jgi:hypothetical protein
VLVLLARVRGVPAGAFGRTGGSRLKGRIGGRPAIDCDVREAEIRWSNALTSYFERQAS